MTTNQSAEAHNHSFQRLAFTTLIAIFTIGASGAKVREPEHVLKLDSTRPMIEAALLTPSETAPGARKAKPRKNLFAKVNRSFTRSLGAWNREKHCLATALYFEARGETERGQKAVAEVIMTRAESGRYPKSICGVVYQNSHRHLSCQFTFTCDGIADRPRDMAAWNRAKRIAATTMIAARHARPITNWATHYHANYVRPRWASKLRHTATVGTHVFYREGSRRI